MNLAKSTRIKPAHLRALVAIAESGSFGEAALTLEISQAAVSYAISTLEEELGVVLLSRGRQGATLTAAGEEMITSARQVLSLLSHMLDVAIAHRSRQGGRVRVGVFRSVGTYLLPPVMAQFRNQFPQITVSVLDYLDSEAVKQALRNYQIDIGFTDDIQKDDEFDTWEILKDEYIVLLPTQFFQPDRSLTWEKLSAYPLISEAPGNIWYTRLYQYLDACGVSLNAAYEIREDSTRVSMVAQNLGFTIIPRLAAQPIPPTVQVCALPVPFERHISVAILKSIAHPPAVFSFLEATNAAFLACPDLGTIPDLGAIAEGDRQDATR